MPTPAFPQSPKIKSVDWIIKEKISGIFIAVRQFRNLVTNYGVTAHAAAPSGQYTPPQYLVIDSAYATVYAVASPGQTSIQLSGDPTLPGDTEIVLSAGTASQEIVSITSITGTTPTTVSLSAPLVNSHASGDLCVRQVYATDTMASVISESQYDPINNPGTRLAMTSSFSPGNGQNTMQFFISGSQATNVVFAHIGLTDQPSMSSLVANLHNYAVLGYNHNNGNDVEIDVTYTLVDNS